MRAADYVPTDDEAVYKSLGKRKKNSDDETGDIARDQMGAMGARIGLHEKVSKVKTARIFEMCEIENPSSIQLWRRVVGGRILAVTLDPTEADVEHGRIGGVSPDDFRKKAYIWYGYTGADKRIKDIDGLFTGKSESEAYDLLKDLHAQEEEAYALSPLGLSAAGKKEVNKVKNEGEKTIKFMANVVDGNVLITDDTRDRIKALAELM